MTYTELCFGIENSAAAVRGARWEQLAAFTRLLLIEPLGERRQALRRGFLRASLRRQGLPIGNNDLFTAAHVRPGRRARDQQQRAPCAGA